MASHKQSPTNMMKARNTIFYPLASAQTGYNNERKVLDQKLAMRQNIHYVKPTIPIIYRHQNTTTCYESKCIDQQSKVLQFPGYSNPTSPRSSNLKQEIDFKKNFKSLENSPLRGQQAQQKENDVSSKQINIITSLSLSPQRQQQQQQEKGIKALIVPFQSAQNKMKKTLVLDLDETLIHSSHQRPEKFDLSFTIQSSTSKEEFFVNFRPNVQKFLKIMANYYEVFIWTASIKEYADVIINQLDPEGNLISYRLYRDSCRKKGDFYIKNLAFLNRNMKDIIIIDNLSTCFNLHQENGIQIQDYTNDESDNELEKLMPFLIFASDVYDVRDVFKWKIKFENQSHFEFKNMQNQNKIHINQSQKTELSHSNIQITAPFFIQNNNLSEIQNNQNQPSKVSQDQLNSKTEQKQNCQSDLNEKGEDYIYRSRRSVSNSIENSNNTSKLEQFSKIVNLEHSFGGNQINNNINNQDEMDNNQFNPLFQEFTFSKLKIEESRVIEEEIGRQTDWIMEKASNKHERVPFKQIESIKQEQNNYSLQFNKACLNNNSSLMMQGYHHSLQPTVFKLLEQPTNQKSNRNTPSFERKKQNDDNKENNRSLQNVFNNIQKSLKEIIEDQKNKQSSSNIVKTSIKPCLKNSSNFSKVNQRYPQQSQSSTQSSDNQRTNFQNSISISEGSQDEQKNVLKDQEKNAQISEQNKEQNNQSIQNQIQKEVHNLNEFNIYQGHPIPKFLQLPSTKQEKITNNQQFKGASLQQFIFQAAKTQCEINQKQQQYQQSQQQKQPTQANQNEKLERLSHKQKNKEIPQIKKDPSIQSIQMDMRRHTIDTLQMNSNNQNLSLDNSQQSQQSKYPKIFNNNPIQQTIPVIGNHISLAQQKQNSQEENAKQVDITEQQIFIPNNQQKMVKSQQPVQLDKQFKTDNNNVSLQNMHNIQQLQQFQPKRHFSQYVSSNQIQQSYIPQNSNYQFIKQILNDTQNQNNKNQMSPNKETQRQNSLQLIDKHPQLQQNITILNRNKQEHSTPIFIQNNQQIFNVKPYLAEQQSTQEQKTPSTASHSKYNNTIEEGSSQKEILIQYHNYNHVQPFEEYAKQSSKAPQVIYQQKIQNQNINQVNNKHNKTFAQLQCYIQQIQ